MSPLDKPFWYQLCENKELRGFLLKMSRSISKDEEVQKDIYQEAWLRIGQLMDGCCIEYYMREGLKAMRAAYMREWRGNSKWNKVNLYKRILRAGRRCKKSGVDSNYSSFEKYDPSVKEVDTYYNLLSHNRKRQKKDDFA